MSDKTRPIRVGYYAPNIGTQRLSAPDYCLQKLVKSYVSDNVDINIQIVMHESSNIPLWLDPSQVVLAPESPIRLERHINNIDIDIIHLNRYYDLLNPYLLDHPKVLTYHGDIQWEFPGLVGSTITPWLARAVEVAKMPAFDHVVFVSDDLRNRVTRRYGPISVDGSTIYNGVDHSIYQPLSRPQSLEYNITSPFVLHVSHLTEKKNPLVLLEAYSKIIGRTDADLVICGSGWPESDFVSDYLSRYELSERVHLLGYVSEEDLVSLYNVAELFVYPSRHETFGLPVVEAMACGTPVVSSEVYAIPEIAGSYAKLCSPTSSDELAKSMITLLNDEIERKKMSLRGRRRSDQFDWAKTSKEYAQLYQSMVNN